MLYLHCKSPLPQGHKTATVVCLSSVGELVCWPSLPPLVGVTLRFVLHFVTSVFSLVYWLSLATVGVYLYLCSSGCLDIVISVFELSKVYLFGSLIWLFRCYYVRMFLIGAWEFVGKVTLIIIAMVVCQFWMTG